MDKVESHLSELEISNSDIKSIDAKWGWPLKDLYRNALGFYKGKKRNHYSISSSIRLLCLNNFYFHLEKSGKAVHFTYEDNLKLVAFSQQALHGPVTDSLPPIGAFDVIGRDRRLAWQHLGTIDKSQAMEGFIDSLDRLCPTFRPYIEAIKKDMEEKDRLAQEEERQRQEQLDMERQRETDRKLIEEQKNREELQKRKLQDALNQQTYLQFRAYAEKQYPGNPEQQGVLIRQLQNEHYHQYMQQLHAQIGTEQLSENPNGAGQIDGNCLNNSGIVGTVDANKSCLSVKEVSKYENEDRECDSENESTDGFPPISPANMWTKPDIEQFKAEVAAGKGEGIIKVWFFSFNVSFPAKFERMISYFFVSLFRWDMVISSQYGCQHMKVEVAYIGNLLQIVMILDLVFILNGENLRQMRSPFKFATAMRMMKTKMTKVIEIECLFFFILSTFK